MPNICNIRDQLLQFTRQAVCNQCNRIKIKEENDTGRSTWYGYIRNWYNTVAFSIITVLDQMVAFADDIAAVRRCETRKR